MPNIHDTITGPAGRPLHSWSKYDGKVIDRGAVRGPLGVKVNTPLGKEGRPNLKEKKKKKGGRRRTRRKSRKRRRKSRKVRKSRKRRRRGRKRTRKRV